MRGGLLAGALVLVGMPASALQFDARGVASFAPEAVWTLSFEPGEANLPVGDPDAGETFIPNQVPDALDGGHVLALGRYDGRNIPVSLPADAASYSVSLWARGEVIGTVEVGYDHAERVDEYGVLYPTGRMTSDGWYELSTRGFSIDAASAKGVVVGVFTPAGAEVDAVELVPDGPARLGAACAGAGDKGTCEAGQICQWGLCRNVTGHVPALPPPEWRDDLIGYLEGRFRYLYGPFKNRVRNLPNALAELDGMRTATDAWTFWRHFRVAIHRLHDWHTSGSDIGSFLEENPKPISVCFIEGEADLSTSIVPSHPSYGDVLVSHVGSVNDLGLAPGDRLVSVDGKHPIEWTRSLISVDFGFWTASNPRTFAEDVSRLPGLIARFADHIEVLRCDQASGQCTSQTETISITDLPMSAPGVGSDIGCDNRPKLHLPGAPENHSRGGFYSDIVVESDATERIYGLQWSSLAVTGDGSNWDMGPRLQEAVQTWRNDARGVILDHRTGFGGTNLGPPIIWDFVRQKVPLDAFLFRARADDQPPSLEQGKQLFDEIAAAGQVEYAGSANPRTDVPVALLIHLDGSASDWLPLGIQGAPRAKIFGPFETAGAFSTLFDFGYWFGVGYSIAVGDTYHFTGETLNGKGVAPDVVVRPLQSDLLAGRDTVYEAALAWVRQELAK